jgi:small ligand-binding sensory domain FIST
MLAEARRAGPAAGALLFSCNGRGSRLFPAPNHDVEALREAFGPIPVVGFFAMGNSARSAARTSSTATPRASSCSTRDPGGCVSETEDG